MKDPALDDAKTLLGFLPSLDAVFTDIQICDYVVTPHRGSYTRAPAGYLFLGGLPGSIGFKPPTALYAHPTDEVRAAAIPRCCNGALGSFEAIRSLHWKEVGRMLVLARDAHLIASPWLCTVPYLSDAEIAAWIGSKSSAVSSS